jgi:hypothetical protein
VTKGMAGEGASEMAPGILPGEVELEEVGEPTPPGAGVWMPLRYWAFCGVGLIGERDLAATEEE